MQCQTVLFGLYCNGHHTGHTRVEYVYSNYSVDLLT